MCSCKKDEPASPNGTITTTFENTDFQYTFNLDGQSFSAIDGINGYINGSNVFYNSNTPNYIYWVHYSMFLDSNFSSKFSIHQAILKPDTLTYTIDDIRSIFHPGAHTYSQDPLTGIVVEVTLNAFTDYTSENGNDQTNSNFIITDTLTGVDTLGVYFKIKANFNCNVYDSFGNQHEITNGIVVCKFQPNY